MAPFFIGGGSVGVFGGYGIIVVILGALSNEEMEMLELVRGGAGVFQGLDDLDEELFEFLAGNGADFKIIEALRQDFGHFGRDWGLRDVQGLVDVEGEDPFLKS